MYKQIVEFTVDPSKAAETAGHYSVIVDCDDSQAPIRLRVSLFKDNHYLDEAVIGLALGEDCVVTDADAWKYRCLDLAAQLDAKEAER